MQNDFCRPEGFFARAGHDVSPCRAAVDSTRRLLATVRPLGLPVLWTKSVSAETPRYPLPPLRFRAPRDSDAFVLGVGGTNSFEPGSWGSEIVDELVPEPGDHVVEKPRYDGFFRTDLERELRRRDVETVAIAGVTTNCCVDTTARQAFIRDFGVLILTDCVGAFANDRDLHDASLKNLSLLFAVCATSDRFLEALQAGALVAG